MLEQLLDKKYMNETKLKGRAVKDIKRIKE